MSYHNRYDITQNYQEVFAFYMKAAKKDNIFAQNDVGYMYMHGQGVELNYDKAFYWIHTSAKNGNATAQNNLGSLYRDGKGTGINYNASFRWTKLSADKGHAEAQNNLGYMYSRGLGTKKNYSEALCWHQLSADQKFTRSNYHIAELYRHGHGVEQDLQKAIRYYLKATDDKDALFELVIIYLEGEGVENNRGKAIAFFDMSLKNGGEEAQVYLDRLTGKTQVQRKSFTEKIPYIEKSLLDVSSVAVKPKSSEGEFSIKKMEDNSIEDTLMRESREAKAQIADLMALLSLKNSQIDDLTQVVQALSKVDDDDTPPNY